MAGWHGQGLFLRGQGKPGLGLTAQHGEVEAEGLASLGRVTQSANTQSSCSLGP